jgi:hypothetical protein
VQVALETLTALLTIGLLLLLVLLHTHVLTHHSCIPARQIAAAAPDLVEIRVENHWPRLAAQLKIELKSQLALYARPAHEALTTTSVTAPSGGVEVYFDRGPVTSSPKPSDVNATRDDGGAGRRAVQAEPHADGPGGAVADTWQPWAWVTGAIQEPVLAVFSSPPPAGEPTEHQPGPGRTEPRPVPLDGKGESNATSVPRQQGTSWLARLWRRQRPPHDGADLGARKPWR